MMKHSNLKKSLSLLKNQLKFSSLKLQFLDLIKGIKKRDLLLLIIFPIAITLIMLLPLWIREILQLNIKNPVWWQYLSQSFVHRNWKHLSSNLFGYFLFSLLGLVLANQCKEKKRFFRFLLFLIITLPILSSYLQIKLYPVLLSWLPNLKHSAGSSGIVSALAGFLPIFWAVYFNKVNKKINLDIRTSCFFLIYIALLFVYIYSRRISPLCIVLFFLFFIFFLSLLLNFKEIFFEISKRSATNILRTFILIVSILFFIVTPIIIFPTIDKMFRGGAFVDFFMHYIGIAYGVLVSSSYFIFINKKWR